MYDDYYTLITNKWDIGKQTIKKLNKLLYNKINMSKKYNDTVFYDKINKLMYKGALLEFKYFIEEAALTVYEVESPATEIVEEVEEAYDMEESNDFHAINQALKFTD